MTDHDTPEFEGQIIFKGDYGQHSHTFKKRLNDIKELLHNLND